MGQWHCLGPASGATGVEHKGDILGLSLLNSLIPLSLQLSLFLDVQHDFLSIPVALGNSSLIFPSGPDSR